MREHHRNHRRIHRLTRFEGELSLTVSGNITVYDDVLRCVHATQAA